MAAYDFSPLANNTNLLTVFQTANSFTNNLLGVAILVIIGLALFFTLRMANTIRGSFAAATFVMALISVFFAVVGLVNVYVPGACIILFMMSAVFLYYQSG